MKRVPVLALVFAVAVLATLSPAVRALTATDPLAEVFSAQSLPQPDLFQPAPVGKCGLTCFPPTYTTATVTGTGTDCTSAQNSLNSQLQNLATSYCVNVDGDIGSCSVVIHNTTACNWVGPTTYQIQGFATHHCKDTTC
jgi:hypothetical protein